MSSSKQAFDKKLAALQSLRDAPAAPATLEQLRKALRDRNNFYVSKVAALIADLSLPDLVPDLLAAFDRFLIDPEKSDPQCWAKNAIAKALKDLGHRGAAIYLKGIVHIQMEPVWGGRADSAATLRGTCALALVDCRLDTVETLNYLAAALADAEMPVRIDAALAISQFGEPEGAPLLRLKALLGDEQPEVMGHCFAALLSLAPDTAVPFIARFLKPAAADTDVALEAVGALAQARDAAAIKALTGFWHNLLPPEVRRAFLTSLAASPLPEAAEFLLGVLAEPSADLAATALQALAASRFHHDFRTRIANVVESRQSTTMSRLFAEQFG